MRGYTAKVGLRKPGTQSWARIIDEWRTLFESGDGVTFTERDRNAAQARMRQTITEAAATLDGLPPEMREQMAHRTLLHKSTGWGEKTDREFPAWMAERLVSVYGESPNVDFVHRLDLPIRNGPQTTSDGLTFTEQEADRNARGES